MAELKVVATGGGGQTAVSLSPDTDRMHVSIFESAT